MHQHHFLQPCPWLFRSRVPAHLSLHTAPNQPPVRLINRNTHDLFNYTSGRWVYNENRRLRERKRVFNVTELQRLAAVAVSQKPEDILCINKLGEGAANRAFLIDFRDGFRLVARIPYPITQPTHLVVASEVATMTFLRSKGIPTPKIYGYSASPDNPAETEYIFMEFSPGAELSTLCFEMDEHGQRRFVTSLVDIETRLFNLQLPASGSLYFHKDLPATVRKLPVDPSDSSRPESLYVGPSTGLELWWGRRNALAIERGPYTDPEDVLKAGAEKECQYLKRHGRPLFPFDRMRRETFHLEKQLPSVHLDSLQKYLQISKDLIPEGSNGLSRPVIRHPDLRPSNIFVSSDYEITALVDWQHSTSLPLFLHSGIPTDLDNSKDSVSRSMANPCLPSDTLNLSKDTKIQQLEHFRKRQLHYAYMAMTASDNPAHFEALTHPFSIGRRKVFQLSGAPWEGDNIPLRSSLIFIKQHWHHFAAQSDIPCPITFTEEEERECLRLDQLEQAAEQQLEASREMLGLGPEGWVSCENYEAAKDAIARMKELCLEQAESELERRAIRDHWVYDDMDEDEYL